MCKNIVRDKIVPVTTKRQRAEHNGVDTTFWNNNEPRIEVPEGWEDHQATQQLIRLYLNDSNARYSFDKNQTKITISKKAWKIINPSGFRPYYLNLYIMETYKGLCLNLYINRYGCGIKVDDKDNDKISRYILTHN